MIQGEPLEKTSKDAESTESITVGQVMKVPERTSTLETEEEAVSTTTDSSVEESIDTEVEELVHALASVERDRDDAWLEAAQDDTDDDRPDDATRKNDLDASLDYVLADVETIYADEVLDTVGPAETTDSGNTYNTEASGERAEQDVPGESMVAMPAWSESTDATKNLDIPSSEDGDTDMSEATKDTEEAVAVAVDGIDNDDSVTLSASADDEALPAQEQSPNLLGLQAINVLNEKIATSENRYDDALTKIGHALGVIAERIDGLEGRMTNQTIANVAMEASPAAMASASFANLSSTSTASDDSVAPYIAQAERELEARKESRPMDIFDRIAKAAETEYDGHGGAGDTRVLQNSSDGRRVGTKRWQPSKTVKRRMEQLEKAKNGELTGDPLIDVMPEEPRSLRADVEEITSGVNAPNAASKDSSSVKAKPMVDLDEEFEEDDDAGLSVVPGARGRRRNRARKSRLDEDFENVFEETEGKPSIQSLRRKMRELPVEPEEEEAPASKGGLLGGILGKKSAAKAAPDVADDAESDEEEMMAAFDAPESKPSKASKASKAKAKPAIDEDDEDWDEEETTRGVNFAGGPLLYVLIAGAAAAAFFAWRTFMG